MAQIQGREIVKIEFSCTDEHGRWETLTEDSLLDTDDVTYWTNEINALPESFYVHNLDEDRTVYAELDPHGNPGDVRSVFLVTFAPAVLPPHTPVKVTGAPGYEDFTGTLEVDVPELDKVVVLAYWDGFPDFHVVPRSCVTTV